MTPCARAPTVPHPPARADRSAAQAWLAAFLACAGGLAACGEPVPVEHARRVVLITCSSLRADRLGVYGYPLATSPEVDRFAREAVVFDEAYCASPSTGPSLSSLLTGRMPEEIGVARGNKYYLSSEVQTLPEVIFGANIPTGAIVSNWLLRRGKPARGDLGVAQGFTFFDDEMRTELPSRGAFERVAPDTSDAALRWLEMRKQTGKDRFFLWVHFQDPHGPYTPPAEIARAFERLPTDEPELPFGEDNTGQDQIPKYQQIPGQQHPESYRIRYDGEVRMFDQGFGRIVEWLKQNAWFDDALIVLSADHGESLGEHGVWFCHGANLNREVVRVPLIVHYPKGAPRPISRPEGGYQRFAPVVGHLDLWPTIIAAFGLPPMENRGESLFSERLPPGRIMPQSYGALNGPTYSRGISDGRFHLLAQDKLTLRMYDTAIDPGELNDVAPAYGPLARQLTERYRAFLEDHAFTPQQGLEMDAKSQQALQSLGYVGGQ